MTSVQILKLAILVVLTAADPGYDYSRPSQVFPYPQESSSSGQSLSQQRPFQHQGTHNQLLPPSQQPSVQYGQPVQPSRFQQPTPQYQQPLPHLVQQHSFHNPPAPAAQYPTIQQQQMIHYQTISTQPQQQAQQNRPQFFQYQQPTNQYQPVHPQKQKPFTYYQGTYQEKPAIYQQTTSYQEKPGVYYQSTFQQQPAVFHQTTSFHQGKGLKPKANNLQTSAYADPHRQKVEIEQDEALSFTLPFTKNSYISAEPNHKDFNSQYEPINNLDTDSESSGRLQSLDPGLLAMIQNLLLKEEIRINAEESKRAPTVGVPFSSYGVPINQRSVVGVALEPSEKAVVLGHLTHGNQNVLSEATVFGAPSSKDR